MYIENVTIENFGPIKNKSLHFKKNGVNLILGHVATGKTQFIGAIHFALTGNHNLLRLDEESDAHQPTTIEVILRSGNRTEQVKCSLNKKQNCQASLERTIISPISAAYNRSLYHDANEAIKTLDTPSLFFSIDHNKSLVFDDLDYDLVDRIIGEDCELKELWRNVRGTIDSKAYMVSQRISVGFERIIHLLYEFLIRYTSKSRIPLIIDENLGVLDQRGLKFASALLNYLAATTQILLFTQIEGLTAYIDSNNLKTTNCLEHPDFRNRSLASYRYEFDKSAIRFPRKNRERKKKKALVVTEGKTDWKHLKTTLKRLQGHGEFDNLNIEFYEYEDDIKMGSAELRAICSHSCKIPNEEILICIFDRDEPGIINSVTSQNGTSYKAWGNNVYSFAIPIPSHRLETPHVCIELYYKDSEITQADASGRRLFLSNEFSHVSGRLKTNNTVIFPYPKKINTARLSIIDHDVYDKEDTNIALPKNHFAQYILNGERNFDTFDAAEFSKIFEVIAGLMKEVSLKQGS